MNNLFKHPRIAPYNSLLIALFCGAALGLTSPPISWWWLHWVLWVPVFSQLKPRETKRNFRYGYLVGFIGVATCFFWISEAITLYSNLPWALAILAVILFAAAYAIPIAAIFAAVRPMRRHFPRGWVFLVPAFAVAMEFLPLGIDQLTGVRLSVFPFFQGATQYRVIELVQIASVTGMIGMTFLVYMTNCAVAECVFRHQEGRELPWRIPAAAFGLVLVNAAWGSWRIQQVNADTADWPTIRISQIQQDITMTKRMEQAAAGASQEGGGLDKLKRTRPSSTISALDSWISLTKAIEGEKIDLMVFPEGSLLSNPLYYSKAKRLAQLTEKMKAPLVVGAGFAIENKGKREDYNSVFLIPEDAAQRLKRIETENPRRRIRWLGETDMNVRRYDKMILLPFGEFIPFEKSFPIVRKWIQGPGKFEPGKSAEPFVISAGEGQQNFSFYTPICYEVMLPHFMRKHMSDADLLVNVTNDGWFGDTMEPHQHAMLSIARSIELGIPMYRLAYTGVSMTATPTGKIQNETKPYTEVSRVVEVQVGQISTVYKRFGDWFGWGCTLLSIGLLIWMRKKPVTDDDAVA